MMNKMKWFAIGVLSAVAGVSLAQSFTQFLNVRVFSDLDVQGTLQNQDSGVVEVSDAFQVTSGAIPAFVLNDGSSNYLVASGDEGVTLTSAGGLSVVGGTIVSDTSVDTPQISHAGDVLVEVVASGTDLTLTAPTAVNVGTSLSSVPQFNMFADDFVVDGFLSVPNGASNAPSIRFSGDTDSGISLPGGTDVGISFGGATRVAVNATRTLSNVDLEVGSSFDVAAASGNTTVNDLTVNGTCSGCAGAGTSYGGFVDAAATAENVPTGWSAANTGTGLYTVTHNLGLSSATDLAISFGIIRAIADDTFINVITPGVNSFTIGINDSGSGAVDSDFFFTAVIVN